MGVCLSLLCCDNLTSNKNDTNEESSLQNPILIQDEEQKEEISMQQEKSLSDSSKTDQSRCQIVDILVLQNHHPLIIKDDKSPESQPSQHIKSDPSQFDMKKVIGRGSCGKVYLVEDKNTYKLYAMKVMSKDILKDRNQENHAMSEKFILERANHPFIVQLHYAFQSSTKLYLVMEFMIGGQDFSTFKQNFLLGELFFHLKKCFRFSEERVRFYAAELVLALSYLHNNGIVYRDLKPENILLNKDGHIKLADFGMSRFLKNDDKSYTICGTPEYVAPEIILKQGHNFNVDWYSLGILIYEMLTGAPPFYQEDRRLMIQDRLNKPVEMMPYFSQQAATLLAGLLQKDPQRRLGANGGEEIMQHPFFQNINWEDILNQRIKPPINLKTNSQDDISYFDDVFTLEPIQDTPVPTNEIDKYYSYKEFSYENNFRVTRSLMG